MNPAAHAITVAHTGLMQPGRPGAYRGMHVGGGTPGLGAVSSSASGKAAEYGRFRAVSPAPVSRGYGGNVRPWHSPCLTLTKRLRYAHTPIDVEQPRL